MPCGTTDGVQAIVLQTYGDGSGSLVQRGRDLARPDAHAWALLALSAFPTCLIA